MLAPKVHWLKQRLTGSTADEHPEILAMVIPGAGSGGTMRIHLINLEAESYPLKTTPLAIIALGGFLKLTCPEVAVSYTDLQHGEIMRDLLPTLERERPEIIGISAQYGTVRQAELVLSALRQEGWFRRACVVAGNVLPTYAYSWLLSEYPELLCCIGRGELFLSRLAAQLAKGAVEPGRLPGCAWSSAGEVLKSDAAKFELTLLPPADWNGLFRRYEPDMYDEIWVEASRGCPHKRGGVGCTYCAIMPDAGSRDWQPRSDSTVMSEIALLAEYRVPHIRFADEEWMADQPDRALSFAYELQQLRKSLASRGIQMPTFDLAMRVDDVMRRNRHTSAGSFDIATNLDHKDNRSRIDALGNLRKSGLKQVYLGIESGSAAQLRRYYKGVRPEDNELALNALRELDVQAACGWIMFDPMVSAAEIQENVSFIRRNDLLPSRPTDSFITYPLSRMRPLEGSPSVKILRARGLLGERMPSIVEYYPRYEHHETSEMVVQVEQWEQGLDRPAMYALKNRVARMAWVEDSIPKDDRMVADIYFDLKRLDLELADELSHAVLAGADTAGFRSIRLRLEAKRTALLETAGELAIGAPLGQRV